MARVKTVFNGRGNSGYQQQNGGGQAPKRRDYPGTLCVRVDKFIEEMELDPSDGKQYPTAVGFVGETTASHEKVFIRMMTNEESLQHFKRSVSGNRRSIQQIRMGAGEQSKRGVNGEMESPENMPINERPIFRCDNVLPVVVNGQEQRTPDGLPMFYTSWITAYCNYMNGPKMEDMLNHVERDSYSTVNFHFAGAKEPDSVNYQTVYQNAVNASVSRLLGQQARQFEGADENQKWRNSNWASAAYQISKTVVDAWQNSGRTSEPFAIASITSWRPEDVIRWTPNDGASDPVESKQALAAKLTAVFSDEIYQPKSYKDPKSGRMKQHVPAVTPDFIVRFLNEKGEVSSFQRFDDYFFAREAKPYEKEAAEFDQQSQAAAKAGDQAAADQYAAKAAASRAEAAKIVSPEGKVEFFVNLLDNLQLNEGETPPVGMDILRGDRFFVTQGLTCTRYGEGQGQAARTRPYQAQTLVQLALEHSYAPYERREDIGCSQLFISRACYRDIVKEIHKTKDGAMYRDAATLAPNGAKLPMSPELAAEHEALVARLQDFNNIPNVAQKMNGGPAPRNAAPAAPAAAQQPFATPSVPDDDGFCDPVSSPSPF